MMMPCICSFRNKNDNTAFGREGGRRRRRRRKRRRRTRCRRS